MKKIKKKFGVPSVTLRSYAESNKTVKHIYIHRSLIPQCWVVQVLPFLGSRLEKVFYRDRKRAYGN